MHETLLCLTAALWLICSFLPPPIAFWDATHCQTLHSVLGLGLQRLVPPGHCGDLHLYDGPGSDNQIRTAVYADREEGGGGEVEVLYHLILNRLGPWLCSFASHHFSRVTLNILNFFIWLLRQCDMPTAFEKKIRFCPLNALFKCTASFIANINSDV